MAGLLSSMLLGPEQRLMRPSPMQSAAPAVTGGLLAQFNPNIANNRWYQAFDRNRDTLVNTLLGGVGAETPLERMRGMAGGAMQGNERAQLLREERRKQEQAQQQINATLQAMQKAGRDDLVSAVQGGLPIADAWKQFLKPAGGDGSAVYGTPIYGTDPDTGETVLGVIGKDGTFKRLDTGGVTPTPGVQWQDFGTYRQGFGKGGQPATAPIPKENYGEAFDKGRGTEEGKAQGEAAASYASMVSKMPGLESVVVDLDKLADRATYTLGGQAVDTARRQLGMEPTDAAIARAEYIAIVDNQVLPLLRDTFGAQFTVEEGKALRATLGDADKSPKEKQAVLKAFIEQKRRNIEALAQQTGQPVAPPTPAAPPRLKFNPATGELE